jgi:hypothetical protein
MAASFFQSSPHVQWSAPPFISSSAPAYFCASTLGICEVTTGCWRERVQASVAGDGLATDRGPANRNLHVRRPWNYEDVRGKQYILCFEILPQTWPLGTNLIMSTLPPMKSAIF